MEAMVIDVENEAFEDYMSMSDGGFDDLRTEADVEELSVIEAVVVDEREALRSDIADLPDVEVWNEEMVSPKTVSDQAEAVAHISVANIMEQDLKTLSEKGLSMLQDNEEDLMPAQEAIGLNEQLKDSEDIAQSDVSQDAAPDTAAASEPQVTSKEEAQKKKKKVQKKAKRPIDATESENAEAAAQEAQVADEDSKTLSASEKSSKKVKKGEKKQNLEKGEIMEASLETSSGIDPQYASVSLVEQTVYTIEDVQILEAAPSLKEMIIQSQFGNVLEASQIEAIIQEQVEILSGAESFYNLENPELQKAVMTQLSAAVVAQQMEQGYLSAGEELQPFVSHEEIAVRTVEFQTLDEAIQLDHQVGFETVDQLTQQGFVESEVEIVQEEYPEAAMAYDNQLYSALGMIEQETVDEVQIIDSTVQDPLSRQVEGPVLEVQALAGSESGPLIENIPPTESLNDEAAAIQKIESEQALQTVDDQCLSSAVVGQQPQVISEEQTDQASNVKKRVAEGQEEDQADPKDTKAQKKKKVKVEKGIVGSEGTVVIEETKLGVDHQQADVIDITTEIVASAPMEVAKVQTQEALPIELLEAKLEEVKQHIQESVTKKKKAKLSKRDTVVLQAVVEQLASQGKLVEIIEVPGQQKIVKEAEINVTTLQLEQLKLLKDPAKQLEIANEIVEEVADGKQVKYKIFSPKTAEAMEKLVDVKDPASKQKCVPVFEVIEIVENGKIVQRKISVNKVDVVASEEKVEVLQELGLIEACTAALSNVIEEQLCEPSVAPQTQVIDQQGTETKTTGGIGSSQEAPGQQQYDNVTQEQESNKGAQDQETDEAAVALQKGDTATPEQKTDKNIKGPESDDLGSTSSAVVALSEEPMKKISEFESREAVQGEKCDKNVPEQTTDMVTEKQDKTSSQQISAVVSPEQKLEEPVQIQETSLTDTGKEPSKAVSKKEEGKASPKQKTGATYDEQEPTKGTPGQESDKDTVPADDKDKLGKKESSKMTPDQDTEIISSQEIEKTKPSDAVSQEPVKSVTGTEPDKDIQERESSRDVPDQEGVKSTPGSEKSEAPQQKQPGNIPEQELTAKSLEEESSISVPEKAPPKDAPGKKTDESVPVHKPNNKVAEKGSTAAAPQELEEAEAIQSKSVDQSCVVSSEQKSPADIIEGAGAIAGKSKESLKGMYSDSKDVSSAAKSEKIIGIPAEEPVLALKEAMQSDVKAAICKTDPTLSSLDAEILTGAVMMFIAAEKPVDIIETFDSSGESKISVQEAAVELTNNQFQEIKSIKNPVHELEVAVEVCEELTDSKQIITKVLNPKSLSGTVEDLPRGNKENVPVVEVTELKEDGKVKKRKLSIRVADIQVNEDNTTVLNEQSLVEICSSALAVSIDDVLASTESIEEMEIIHDKIESKSPSGKTTVGTGGILERTAADHMEANEKRGKEEAKKKKRKSAEKVESIEHMETSDAQPVTLQSVAKKPEKVKAAVMPSEEVVSACEEILNSQGGFIDPSDLEKYLNISSTADQYLDQVIEMSGEDVETAVKSKEELLEKKKLLLEKKKLIEQKQQEIRLKKEAEIARAELSSDVSTTDDSSGVDSVIENRKDLQERTQTINKEKDIESSSGGKSEGKQSGSSFASVDMNVLESGDSKMSQLSKKFESEGKKQTLDSDMPPELACALQMKLAEAGQHAEAILLALEKSMSKRSEDVLSADETSVDSAFTEKNSISESSTADVLESNIGMAQEVFDQYSVDDVACTDHLPQISHDGKISDVAPKSAETGSTDDSHVPETVSTSQLKQDIPVTLEQISAAKESETVSTSQTISDSQVTTTSLEKETPIVEGAGTIAGKSKESLQGMYSAPDTVSGESHQEANTKEDRKVSAILDSKISAETVSDQSKPLAPKTLNEHPEIKSKSLSSKGEKSKDDQKSDKKPVDTRSTLQTNLDAIQNEGAVEQSLETTKKAEGENIDIDINVKESTETVKLPGQKSASGVTPEDENVSITLAKNEKSSEKSLSSKTTDEESKEAIASKVIAKPENAQKKIQDKNEAPAKSDKVIKPDDVKTGMGEKKTTSSAITDNEQKSELGDVPTGKSTTEVLGSSSKEISATVDPKLKPTASEKAEGKSESVNETKTTEITLERRDQSVTQESTSESVSSPVKKEKRVSFAHDVVDNYDESEEGTDIDDFEISSNKEKLSEDVKANQMKSDPLSDEQETCANKDGTSVREDTKKDSKGVLKLEKDAASNASETTSQSPAASNEKNTAANVSEKAKLTKIDDESPSIDQVKQLSSKGKRTEIADLTTEKSEQGKSCTATSQDEDVDASVKMGKKEPATSQDEDVDASVEIGKKQPPTSKDEDVDVDASAKIGMKQPVTSQDEDVDASVKIGKKQSATSQVEDVDASVKIGKKQPATSQEEDVDASVKIGKKQPATSQEEDDDASVKIGKKQPATSQEEDVDASVKIGKKQPATSQEEDVDASVKIGKKQPATSQDEDVDASVKIGKKQPATSQDEDVDASVKIGKKQPATSQEEDDDASVKIGKKQPATSQEEDVDASVKIGKKQPATSQGEDVDASVTIGKKQPVTSQGEDVDVDASVKIGKKQPATSQGEGVDADASVKIGKKQPAASQEEDVDVDASVKVGKNQPATCQDEDVDALVKIDKKQPATSQGEDVDASVKIGKKQPAASQEEDVDVDASVKVGKNQPATCQDEDVDALVKIGKKQPATSQGEDVDASVKIGKKQPAASQEEDVDVDASVKIGKKQPATCQDEDVDALVKIGKKQPATSQGEDVDALVKIGKKQPAASQGEDVDVDASVKIGKKQPATSQDEDVDSSVKIGKKQPATSQDDDVDASVKIGKKQPASSQGEDVDASGKIGKKQPATSQDEDVDASVKIGKKQPATSQEEDVNASVKIGKKQPATSQQEDVDVDASVKIGKKQPTTSQDEDVEASVKIGKKQPTTSQDEDVDASVKIGKKQPATSQEEDDDASVKIGKKQPATSQDEDVDVDTSVKIGKKQTATSQGEDVDVDASVTIGKKQPATSQDDVDASVKIGKKQPATSQGEDVDVDASDKIGKKQPATSQDEDVDSSVAIGKKKPATSQDVDASVTIGKKESATSKDVKLRAEESDSSPDAEPVGKSVGRQDSKTKTEDASEMWSAETKGEATPVDKPDLKKSREAVHSIGEGEIGGEEEASIDIPLGKQSDLRKQEELLRKKEKEKKKQKMVEEREMEEKEEQQRKQERERKREERKREQEEEEKKREEEERERAQRRKKRIEDDAAAAEAKREEEAMEREKEKKKRREEERRKQEQEEREEKEREEKRKAKDEQRKKELLKRDQEIEKEEEERQARRKKQIEEREKETKEEEEKRQRIEEEREEKKKRRKAEEEAERKAKEEKEMEREQERMKAKEERRKQEKEEMEREEKKEKERRKAKEERRLAELKEREEAMLREEEERQAKRKRQREEKERELREEEERLRKAAEEREERRRKHREEEAAEKREEEAREREREEKRIAELEKRRKELDDRRREEERKIMEEEEERRERRKQKRLDEDKAQREEQERWEQELERKRERRMQQQNAEDEQLRKKREADEKRRQEREAQRLLEKQEKLKKYEEQEKAFEEAERKRREDRVKRDEAERMRTQEEEMLASLERKRVEEDKRRLEEELRRREEIKRRQEEEIRQQGEEFLRRVSDCNILFAVSDII